MSSWLDVMEEKSWLRSIVPEKGEKCTVARFGFI
jgi:hypothetical protein